MYSTSNSTEVAKRQLRKLKTTLFGFAACLALAGSAWAASPPQPHQCQGLPVTVTDATPEDAANVCEGAGAAVAFFRSQGFAIPPAIRVKAQAELPPKCGSTAVGCFFKDDSLVLLLPYSQLKQDRTLFRLPIDRRLYVSVAIHEVAHALAAFNSSVSYPSIQATEYVAHVTTFAAMDTPTRNRVLKAYAPMGAEAASPSFVLLLFDPMQFGVHCYRHYIQEADGAAFLRDVLSGRALAD